MQGIARIVGGALSFLSVFVLTYLFSEEILGKYNLVLTTINVITSISTLWLTQSILRFYKDKNQIGSLLVLALVCSFLSLILFNIYALTTATSSSIWAYLYIFVLVAYNFLDAILRKGRRLIYYVILELLFSVGRLFPMVILVKITNDYNSIFTSQFLIIVLFLIVLVIKENGIFKTTSYKLDKSELLKFVRYGVPLVGLAVSNWFLTSSDRYIIRFMGDDVQVGIYSTNYSLGNSIYMMFALILINAMHPVIISLWEKNKNESIKAVSKTLYLYLLFMTPLVFYGTLKSKVLLSLFKGISYSNHYSIFIWTVLGIYIYGISMILHKYFECIQKTNIILYLNIIAAGLNILLNLILIPLFGFEIAALTTFISYLLYAFLVWLISHKHFPISIPFSKIILVLLSVVVFYVADFFIIQSESVLVFLLEGLIYVVYTLIIYQIFRIYNIKLLLRKKLGKNR